MNPEYDVIIIGAGIGGLIAGNYLAKKGVKTLICEQHATPGGYVCGHWTTMPAGVPAAALTGKMVTELIK